VRGACAIGTPAIVRRFRRHELLIVNYHGLRTDESTRRAWLLLPRAQFVEQIRYLAANYRVLAVDDALARLRSGGLDEPTVCVTFDDGYRNNLTIGLPILRQFDVPATIYLASGLIGTSARLWTTRIELAFAVSRRDIVDLSAVDLGVHRLGDADTHQRVRARLGRATKERLKTFAAAQRSALVDYILAALDAGDTPDDGEFAFLTWEQVSALGETGLVTFGAHTVGHEILSRLDDDAVDREVGESVERVRATGYESASFAYPNGGVGDFDDRAAKALRRVAIPAALTTLNGLNGPSTDPYALRRVVVGADMSIDQFRLHTSGATSMLAARGTAPGADRVPNETVAGAVSAGRHVHHLLDVGPPPHETHDERLHARRVE
jgi:peptidoglycan/xylan/chitin deacetylase (PgdA/CDA1 family)